MTWQTDLPCKAVTQCTHKSALPAGRRECKSRCLLAYCIQHSLISAYDLQLCAFNISCQGVFRPQITVRWLKQQRVFFVLNVTTGSDPLCASFLSGPLSPRCGEGGSSADGTAQHQLAFLARQPCAVRPEAAGHAPRQALCVLLCQLWVCLHVLTLLKTTNTA